MLNYAKWRVASASTLLLALLLSCEEPSAPAPSASARAVPAPPSPQSPTAPEKELAQPAAPKPKKKVEDCPKGPQVAIGNEAIEAQVRLKLQKPTGPITTADLKRLKSLNVSNVEFNELDVCIFSHMTGLKELFLGRGEYDDLSPIAGAVQLESLRASLSRVRDLKPLEKMTKMDRLDLGHTQVSDLTPLASMSELTELQLDDTPVENLAPLAKLTKLQNLSIKRTRVNNVSSLKDLKLKFIYVGGSPLEDEPVALAPLRASGAHVDMN